MSQTDKKYIKEGHKTFSTTLIIWMRYTLKKILIEKIVKEMEICPPLTLIQDEHKYSMECYNDVTIIVYFVN